MTKLVITEKPSVAQTIAKVIGAKNRNYGYKMTGSSSGMAYCKFNGKMS